MGYSTHRKKGCWYDILTVVAERFHLDSVTNADGTTWFTLVIEDPVNYFVEQYNDAKIAFVRNETRHILRSEIGKHWVNGVPLVMLVENKLGELAEDAHIKALKSSPQYAKQNPRPEISNQDGVA